MIHFNELKSNARSLFETYKKVLDFEKAIKESISSVCDPFQADQIILPGKVFITIDEESLLICAENPSDIDK